MKTPLFSLIALFVLAIGCGGEGEKATAPAAPSAAAPATPAAAAPAAPAPTPAPAAPPTADQLPVPEDFEAEAEGAISAENYKVRFAQIDHEIEKDCAE